MYRTFVHLGDRRAAARERSPAGGCEMPARLLIGERDPLGRGAGGGVRAPRRRRGWEVVPGAGHFLPEERPEVVVARARELLG